jgi:hypothetical protein
MLASTLMAGPGGGYGGAPGGAAGSFGGELVLALTNSSGGHLALQVGRPCFVHKLHRWGSAH